MEEMPEVVSGRRSECRVSTLFSHPSKFWLAALLQIFVSFHNQAKFLMFVSSALNILRFNRLFAFSLCWLFSKECPSSSAAFFFVSRSLQSIF